MSGMVLFSINGLHGCDDLNQLLKLHRLLLILDGGIPDARSLSDYTIG
jgi:hypothetical protein